MSDGQITVNSAAPKGKIVGKPLHALLSINLHG
jgi:hypothetical protein